MLMPDLMQKTVLAFGLAGALALGSAIPSVAAPLPSGTAAVKTASPGTVTDVRWRGGGPGPFFAGALIGSAVAAGAYGPYYPYYGGYYPYYRPYPYYYGGPYRYYRPYRHYRYYRHW
jgi:hypothetical protein